MITALLLAAAVSATPITADGRVDAPEGFHARLPAGFRYDSFVDGGNTSYRAADRASGSLVTVGMEDVGPQVQCPESGEVEARPGVRMQVTAVRTRAGLNGCVIRTRAAEGTMVLAFVYGPEQTAVAVLAVAKEPDLADRLARGVAESVRFAPVAAVDARIVGCFRRDGSSAVAGGGDSPHDSWTTTVQFDRDDLVLDGDRRERQPDRTDDEEADEE